MSDELAGSVRDSMLEKSNLESVTRRLNNALDAAAEENLRLARELEEAEAGSGALVELLTLFVETWRSGGDLGSVVNQVSEELRKRRRVQ